MPKSAAKPQKPKDFPLTPHSSGGWCKKVKGKIYYFGTWADPEGALKEYQAVKDSLQAGVDPRRLPAGLVNVEELFNRYMHAQKLRAEAGDLSWRTWRERRDLCSRVADFRCVGRTTPVVGLTPENFQKLRAELAKIYGAIGQRNALVKIRAIFRWGFESQLYKLPINFGPDFRAPQMKTVRRERRVKGRRLADAVILRKILKAASQPMHSMVLLALNGGCGNRDIAGLPLSLVDFKTPWLDYPRSKTEIDRRIPLWPETIKSLKAALEQRPQSDLPNFYVTKYGNAWAWENNEGKSNDEVGKQFRKMLKANDLAVPGLSFYSLRRTFRTIADQTKDQPACDVIMGHAPDPADMRSHYVLHIDDGRLKAVTDHVRSWLFAKKPKSK